MLGKNLVILIISMLISTYLQAGKSTPVMVGGEDDLDACSEMGMVQGINKRGDGFVSVRSGPGTKYRIKNKIYKNGKQVFVCDSRGKWVGVVYGRDDCGVSSPIQKRQPYRGQCKTGWIYGQYVGNGYSVEPSAQKINVQSSQRSYYSIDQLFAIVNHQNTDLQNKLLTEKLKAEGVVVKDICIVTEVDRDDGLFGDKNIFTIDCSAHHAGQVVKLKTNNPNVVNIHRGDRIPFKGTIKSLDAMNDYMKIQSLVVNL